jgi:hypothetical protein
MRIFPEGAREWGVPVGKAFLLIAAGFTTEFFLVSLYTVDHFRGVRGRGTCDLEAWFVDG